MGGLLEAGINRGRIERLAEQILKELLASIKGQKLILIEINR